MTPLIVKYSRSFLKYSHDPERWHWFDFTGSVDRSIGIDFEKWLSIYRPPFPRTIMTFQEIDDGETKEIFLTIHGDDVEAGIRVVAMLSFPDRGDNAVLVEPILYFIKDGKFFAGKAETPEGVCETIEAQKFVMQTLAAFLRTLSKSQNLAYIPTAEKTFINQRRAERDKPPKYTWRTIVISGEAVMREDRGGTHASPRYHDRRGHQRRLRSGKVVWVKSCKVGDPSKGAVFKDYVVRPLQ